MLAFNTKCCPLICMYIYIYKESRISERSRRGVGLDYQTLLQKLSVHLSMLDCSSKHVVLDWKKDITHRNQTKHVKYVAYLLGKIHMFLLFPFQSRHKKKQSNFTRQNSLYLGKQKHMFVPKPSNQTTPSPPKKNLSNFTHPLFSQRCSRWWLNQPMSKIWSSNSIISRKNQVENVKFQKKKKKKKDLWFTST